jgi:sugar lactone lactonase YvrE
MRIPSRRFLTVALCVTALSIIHSVPAQTGCAPVPAGLVGWWAGEGNANDSTGANNGVLKGGVTFVPGEVGRAFSFDGTTASVQVPASASLNLGTNAGMTIELWINPVDVLTNGPLVEWNNGSFGVLLDIAVPVSVGGAGPGSFCGYFKDINLAGHAVNSPPGALKPGIFQHVAVTYDKASGQGAAFLNGALVGQVFLGAFTPMTLGDLYFGFRPFDAGAGIRYAGLMDEVSLYDRALSAAEIQGIYAAGSSGKCALPPVIAVEPQGQTVAAGGTATFTVEAGGSPPFSYQWSFKGSNLAGATNATLTLTDAGLGAAGVYSVTVSNAGGAVTSSSATLTVSAQSTYTAYAFTNLAGMPGVSGSADGTGREARFDGPPGVAVDTAGNVYVADSTNNTIRKVTSGGVVTTLAGLAGSPGSADGTGSAARFSAPTGVAVDSAGNIYVGDAGNAVIRKVTPAGVVTTLAGLAGATGSADGAGSDARFYQPAGVAVDRAGNVYVADYFNNTIRKVMPGGVVTTLAGQAGQAGSTDGTGRAAQFYAPFAVAVDTTGNVYVADQFNQTIRKLTPAGVVTTLAGQAMRGSADGIGSAAQFSSPSGVAVDAAGNVYVGDQLNETIRKITPAGAVTTLAGQVGSSGSADGIGDEARFNKPCGVAVDSAGYLYVADAWNNRITKGTPSGCVPYGATATATVVNGFVVGATITGGGCGYTNTPAVSFQGGGGTGAEGTAVVANGVVVSIIINDAGIGYTNTPVVEVAPPFGLAPQILSQPASALGYWGEGITFQVQAEGTPPLSYQWYIDDIPISWGTNASLALSNLQLTDAGAYSVQITNLYGRVLSGPATLTVNPAGVSLGLYTGLTISGAVGNTFGIQYATSLNATNTWTTITNLTLTQPVQLWVDTSVNASGGTGRLYRVVAVP